MVTYEGSLSNWLDVRLSFVVQGHAMNYTPGGVVRSWVMFGTGDPMGGHEWVGRGGKG